MGSFSRVKKQPYVRSFGSNKIIGLLSSLPFFFLLSFSFSFLMVFFVGWLGVISCSYNSVMLIFVVVVVVVVVVVCLF